MLGIQPLFARMVLGMGGSPALPRQIANPFALIEEHPHCRDIKNR